MTTQDNGNDWKPGDESTLTQDQQDCIQLLEFTLAEARKGTFHAMAIVGVTAQGFGSQIVGSNVPATYMGLGMALRELEDKFKAPPAPVNRQRPTILRPGGPL